MFETLFVSVLIFEFGGGRIESAVSQLSKMTIADASDTNNAYVGTGNRLWVNSKVSNWPGNKLKVDASGTVGVNNFPQTQTVDGAVSVDSLPDVSGTVAVSNLPAVQPVSGDVSVNNLPATQDVAVSNFPPVQSVDVVGPNLPEPSSIKNLKSLNVRQTECGAGFTYTVPVDKTLLVTEIHASNFDNSSNAGFGFWSRALELCSGSA